VISSPDWTIWEMASAFSSSPPPRRSGLTPARKTHGPAEKSQQISSAILPIVSLLANPTKKLAAPRDAEGKRRNAKRVAISTREDLIAWLERKAGQHGFQVDTHSLQTLPRPRQVFVKKSTADAQRHAGLHTATEFIGILKITDPTAFLAATHSGIGSAKAFGFGLLCLSPS
jgi:CRISPR-associated protein Cas6/Cse3/CasE subtype I-E